MLKSPYHGFFKTISSYGVEYSSKGMKTSCKDLYLKVHRIQSYCLSKVRVNSESMK